MVEIYWLWLCNLKGIGHVTQRKLIDAFGSPQSIFEATEEELRATQGLREGMINTLLTERSLEVGKKTLQLMHEKNIELLTLDNPLYPYQASSLPSQPAVLFYRGKLQSGGRNIGIVGSRRCSSYGKEVSAEAASFLAKSGITVVSGLAKGIDSYAHTACIKEGGYTLAFVANGPDICYPPEHQTLMDQIIESGAVISAYPPGTRPRQEYFPLRNKIMAAWVDKLFVVEAGERSGALITATYAMEYKRKVLAAPNDIYMTESKGSNHLLLSGAEVYLKPEQLLDQTSMRISSENRKTLINEKKANNRENINQYNTEIEERVLKELEHPKEINYFLHFVDHNLSELTLLLCNMELEGKICIQGNRVKRIETGV